MSDPTAQARDTAPPHATDATDAAEARRLRCGDRAIHWSAEQGWRRGGLYDVSRHGVGFVTPADAAPEAGATLRIRPDRRDDPLTVRVVHVRPVGRYAIVGCARRDAA